MASLDTDINMIPAGEGPVGAGPSSKKPKRFEIKKWNAVALWAWGLGFQFFDYLLIPCWIDSRMQILSWITVLFAGTISWISVLSAKLIKLALRARNALWLGVYAITLFTSTASVDG
eukprot:TRINITY_DN937_c0_g1_i6.p1 TRINITY_DN937_c0_g1~~TRINITY_DN937_c0_g1_i6.p1  ORF type:complete len:117 (-),score=6.80 TRINITY_DN937_c0_g1_i6:197-547(-)